MDEIKRRAKAFEKLKEIFNSQDSIILVEGKKDKKALLALGLGVQTNIFTVGGKRLDVIDDSIDTTSTSGRKRIIILTDFDETGEELRKRLSFPGFFVDFESAKKLRWIFGIKTIEDLPSAFEEFEKKRIEKRGN